MEQHFLVDPDKLKLLVDTAAVRPTDRVLQLGAGAGTVAAALPACNLTLVELDQDLAAQLKRSFPAATVLQEDALMALRRLEFDVLLSNLPHHLTRPVLELLRQKSFRSAVLAVHDNDALTELHRTAQRTLTLRTLGVLEPCDFAPHQPFKSKLLLASPRPSSSSRPETS